MKKKILSFLLCAIMVFSLLPVGSASALFDEAEETSRGIVTAYSTTAEIITISELGTVLFDDAKITGDIAVGDNVVYYTYNDEVNIIKVTPVEGDVEALNDDGSVVIGGKTYSLWEKAYTDWTLDLYSDDTLASLLLRKPDLIDGGLKYYAYENTIISFEVLYKEFTAEDYAVIIKSIYDETLDKAYVTLGHVDNTQTTYEVGKLNVENRTNPYDEKNDKASDFADNTFFGMVVKYKVMSNGKLDLSDNDLGYTSGKQTFLGSKEYDERTFYSSTRYDKGVFSMVAEGGELTVDGETYYALNDSSVIFVLYGNPQYQYDKTVLRDAAYTPVKAVAYKLNDKVYQPLGYINNMLIDDSVVSSAYTLSYALDKPKENGRIVAAAMTIGSSEDYDTGAALPDERYTVSYDANGGENTPSGQAKYKGYDICITQEKPYREGYVFKGWAESSNGDVTYEPGEKYSEDKNITLYAVWETDTYDVSDYAVIIKSTYDEDLDVAYVTLGHIDNTQATYAVGKLNVENSSNPYDEKNDKASDFANNTYFGMVVKYKVMSNGKLDLSDNDLGYTSGKQTVLGSKAYSDAAYYSSSRYDKGIMTVNAEGGELTVDGETYYALNDSSVIFVIYGNPQYVRNTTNGKFPVIRDSNYVPIKAVAYKLNDKVYQPLGYINNMLIHDSVVSSAYTLSYALNTAKGINKGIIAAAMTIGSSEDYDTGTALSDERYTVSYDANGGQNTPSGQAKYKGYDICITQEKPYREGYVFKGWAESSNGDVAYEPGAKYSEDKNITLYAVWEIDTYDVNDYAVIIKSTYDADIDVAYVTLGHTDNTEATYEIGKFNVEDRNYLDGNINDKASDFACNTYFGMVVKYEIMEDGRLDLSENDFGYASGRQTQYSGKMPDTRSYYSSSRFDKGISEVIACEGEIELDGYKVYSRNDESVIFVLYGNPRYTSDGSIGRDWDYMPLTAKAYKLNEKNYQYINDIPDMYINYTLYYGAYAFSWVLDKSTGFERGIVAAAMTIGSDRFCDTGKVKMEDGFAYVAAATQKYDIPTKSFYREMTLIDENGLKTMTTVSDLRDFSNSEIYFDNFIGKVESEYRAGIFVTYACDDDGRISYIDNSAYCYAQTSYDGETSGIHLVNVVAERNGEILFLPTDCDLDSADAIANATAYSLPLSYEGYDIITIDKNGYAGKTLAKIPEDATGLEAEVGNAVIEIHRGEIVRVFSFPDGYSFDEEVVDVTTPEPEEPEIPEHTPGDVDASGKVDSRDIILIRRYIAGGYGVTLVEAAADVDANGKIDSKDIILIRRYIAGGYDVELK